MSFLARLWRFVKSPTRYVGRDLEGNKFYEYPVAGGGKLCSGIHRASAALRCYQEGHGEWSDITAKKTCGSTSEEGGACQGQHKVQWSSWLTHTRQDPPTVKELQADMNRQQRVQANAALIDAREREEHARLLRPSAAPSESTSDDRPPQPQRQISSDPEGKRQPPSEQSQASEPPSSQEKPSPFKTDPVETQQWTPRTLQRS